MKQKFENFKEISNDELKNIEGGIGPFIAVGVVGGVILVGFGAGAIMGYYANKK